jgi:hypothetical protein
MKEEGEREGERGRGEGARVCRGVQKIIIPKLECN